MNNAVLINSVKTTEQKVFKFIINEKLLSDGDKVIIALSGGPDSVFLLNLLNKFKAKLGVELAAFHINHKLRGDESDEDEGFCRDICSRLDIDFKSEAVDALSYSKKFKISLEEGGRKLRYSLLENFADENKFTKIATGHTLNDNTETVLLNLFKGAGLAGVSGIPVKRGKIIRPVLCADANEILRYLKVKNINYRIDSSNLSNEFQRNFLRNKVIPLIKDNINPALDTVILNSSKIFKNSRAAIKKIVKDISSEIICVEDEKIIIDINKIKEYGTEILGEILKDRLKQDFSYIIKFDDLEKLKSLFEKQKGKNIQFADGITAYRERGKIILKRETAMLDADSVELSVGQRVNFGNHTFGIDSIKSNAASYSDSKDTEIISADNLDDLFILRYWKNGDKFIPLGMRNFKKISDFLSEQLVPAHSKKEHVVLTNKGNIIWVPGLRIDNRVRIKKGSKRILKIWKK